MASPVPVSEMPWRRVVDPRPVTKFCFGVPVADHHDLLECGHVVSHSMCERAAARKRRCYLCVQPDADEWRGL